MPGPRFALTTTRCCGTLRAYHNILWDGAPGVEVASPAESPTSRGRVMAHELREPIADLADEGQSEEPIRLLKSGVGGNGHGAGMGNGVTHGDLGVNGAGIV